MDIRLPALTIHLIAAIACFVATGCPRPATELPPRTPRPVPVAESGTKSTTLSDEDELAWTDITRQAGIKFQHRNGEEAGHLSLLESLGGGVALFDYDGDGQLDMFYAGGGQFSGEQIQGLPSTLYRQISPLDFRDVSQPAGEGFPSTYYTHGCFAGDFDNDGFTDLLVTGYGGLQLWRNLGDGTFEEQQFAAGLNDERWSTAAAWGDFNEDGDLDLYVAHYVDWSFEKHKQCLSPESDQADVCSPSEFAPVADDLWLSNGDGTFRNASLEGGLRNDGRGLGVAAVDVNGDGHLDIFVANDSSENFLYLNDGFGVFTERSSEVGVAIANRGLPARSSGVAVGDFNQDGYPDLWVTNGEGEAFSLYMNEGDGTFLDATHVTDMTQWEGQLVGFGTRFVDLNRNGFADLIMANGHVRQHPVQGSIRQKPLVLLNSQGRRFRVWEPAEDLYFMAAHIGRGLAAGDLNNNGAMDLVFTHNNSQPTVLHNDRTEQGQWLGVRLIGRQSPRDGTGTQLELETERTFQWQFVAGGTSYLSQSDFRIFWGFPDGDRPMRLTVNWPSGQDQVISLPPARKVLTLVEP